MIFVLYSTLIPEADYAAFIKNYLPAFSKDFQEKIKRYQRWENGCSSLLGRLLLKKGLEIVGENLDERKVKLTENGKPFLENSNVRFNISHSGALVVCAITKISDIGIDIEKINPVQIEDFRHQMTAGEWMNVNSHDNPLLHFYKYWTQKEAVLKADGKGLSVPLQSFEIRDNKTIVNAEAFFLYDIILHEHYCCSIALKRHISYSDIQIVKVNTF